MTDYKMSWQNERKLLEVAIPFIVLSDQIELTTGPLTLHGEDGWTYLGDNAADQTSCIMFRWKTGQDE